MNSTKENRQARGSVLVNQRALCSGNSRVSRYGDTPADMCIESLPRRPIVVTFDNASRAMKLMPGMGGKGAILQGWTDPIGDHDRKVLEVEEAMLEGKRLVAELKFCGRVEKNWEIAYGLLLNGEPHKLKEYEELKQEMKSFEKKYQRAETAEERMTLEDLWKKFCEMETKFEKVVVARDQYEIVKLERDKAKELVLSHSKRMSRLREEEMAAAAAISEDHVCACDMGKSLGEVFPAIQIGYIIVRLFGITDIYLEDIPFQQVLDELRVAPPPHTLEFMRYDFQWDHLGQCWESLQEIRQQGKYVRDARQERLWFVQACREGDISELSRRLEIGEDVESTDMQGNTGMHVAAAQGEVEVMAFLLGNRADLEVRNKNMETPLMVAAKCGCVESVSWLLEKRAKLDTLDRVRRSPLMNAILSSHHSMALLLMDFSPSLRGVDINWGWTALHFAANAGDVVTLQALLDRRASLYALSKTGQTPLDVARKAGHKKATELLEAQLASEPAHEVFSEGGMHLWQGSHKAAHPIWATDQAFKAVLTLSDPRMPDKKLNWLEDDEELEHLRVELEVDDDDTTQISWGRLVQNMKAMIEFMHDVVRRTKKILVHCPNGRSTSVAVIAAYRLLKQGVNVRHTVRAISQARPGTQVTPAMAEGLQRLQDDFDKEKETRLANRIRMAPVISLGF